jgi:hypothetical protein
MQELQRIARITFLRTMANPDASAPCAWRPCFAISRAIVLTFCDRCLSCVVTSTPPLWHIGAVGASTSSVRLSVRVGIAFCLVRGHVTALYLASPRRERGSANQVLARYQMPPRREALALTMASGELQQQGRIGAPSMVIASHLRTAWCGDLMRRAGPSSGGGDARSTTGSSQCRAAAVLRPRPVARGRAVTSTAQELEEC